MVYLFLSGDDYLVGQRLKELRAALGDPEMADLNVSRYSGGEIGATHLLAQAGMMPFLAPRRLLILDGYLHHLNRRMSMSQSTASAAHQEAALLMDGLTNLPDFTDIVFVEEKGLDKRQQLWRGFRTDGADGDAGRKAPGLAAMVKAGQISAEEQTAPDARQLPAWIQQEAKAKGIRLDGTAVQMLANYVGANLRQLQHELDKLGAYATGRAVTPEDVQLLVSDASEALIWDLTDGLSQRNGAKAMRSLAELRRGDANPFYLLTMIARQYRIIVKVKDAMAVQRGNEYDIAKVVGEKPYPVKKAMQQSRAYSFQELHGIMNRLLEADAAMKTGADQETEIDLIVAELTRSR